MRTTTRIGGALLMSASMTLAACGGNRDDATTTDTAAAGSVSASGEVAPSGAMTPADSTGANASSVPSSTGALTDPEVITLGQASDQGEIATSQIAKTKATNAEVRAYAQRMITAHTKMISDRNALVKAQSMTPSKAANDSAAATGQKMVAALEAAPKGVTFDTAYVNGQVMAHTATLDMLKKAQGSVQNAELKAAVEKAIPDVQKHLDDAKALQGKVAGGAQ